MSTISAGNTISTSVVITGDTTGNLTLAPFSGSKVILTGPLQYADGTTSNTAASGGFAAGTLMLFVQTAAPTGWTKSTANNDKALRVVSGTASTGGSVAFTTAFANTSAGATTLSTSQLAAHSHDTQIAGGPGSPASFYYASTWGATNTIQTAQTGSGASHTHSLTLAVQYVDVIIATKD